MIWHRKPCLLHTHLQWQRNQVVAAALSLLNDVAAVVALPERIEAALAVKDWPLAVSLLLEACSRLARDEMARVGALKRMRAGLGAMSRWVQGFLFTYSGATASELGLHYIILHEHYIWVYKSK